MSRKWSPMIAMMRHLWFWTISRSNGSVINFGWPSGTGGWVRTDLTYSKSACILLPRAAAYSRIMALSWSPFPFSGFLKVVCLDQIPLVWSIQTNAKGGLVQLDLVQGLADMSADGPDRWFPNPLFKAPALVLFRVIITKIFQLGLTAFRICIMTTNKLFIKNISQNKLFQQVSISGRIIQHERSVFQLSRTSYLQYSSRYATFSLLRISHWIPFFHVKQHGHILPQLLHLFPHQAYQPTFPPAMSICRLESWNSQPRRSWRSLTCMRIGLECRRCFRLWLPYTSTCALFLACQWNLSVCLAGLPCCSTFWHVDPSSPLLPCEIDWRSMQSKPWSAHHRRYWFFQNRWIQLSLVCATNDSKARQCC